MNGEPKWWWSRERKQRHALDGILRDLNWTDIELILWQKFDEMRREAFKDARRKVPPNAIPHKVDVDYNYEVKVHYTEVER